MGGTPSGGCSAMSTRCPSGDGANEQGARQGSASVPTGWPLQSNARMRTANGSCSGETGSQRSCRSMGGNAARLDGGDTCGGPTAITRIIRPTIEVVARWRRYLPNGLHGASASSGSSHSPSLSGFRCRFPAPNPSKATLACRVRIRRTRATFSRAGSLTLSETAIDTTARRKRRRSRLLRVVSAILVVLLALLVGYALWTVYENTLTPAALGQGPSTNAQPAPPGVLSATAARALKAYGGEAVWKDAIAVDSRVTVGGLLFQLKGRNIPPHAKITVDVKRPHTVINPVDQSGDIGVLDGFNVEIVSPAGTILEQRTDAREHLQNAAITTKWDRLNLVYFLGYAFWGYYTLPYEHAN